MSKKIFHTLLFVGVFAAAGHPWVAHGVDCDAGKSLKDDSPARKTETCKQVCSDSGGWNGQWRNIGYTKSFCGCNGPKCVVPHEVDCDAGISLVADTAAKNCPKVCSKSGGWNGQWTNKTSTGKGVCGCKGSKCMAP